MGDSGSLGIEKIDSRKGLLSGMTSGRCNLILTIKNQARENVAV